MSNYEDSMYGDSDDELERRRRGYDDDDDGEEDERNAAKLSADDDSAYMHTETPAAPAGAAAGTDEGGNGIAASGAAAMSSMMGMFSGKGKDGEAGGPAAGSSSMFNIFGSGGSKEAAASQDGSAASSLSPSFLNANTFVSNAGVIVLAIFVTILLLKFALAAIMAYFNPSTVVLFRGMIMGNQQMVIVQDPSGSSNTIPLSRSTNQTGGMEFTWSVWVFIDNLQYNEGTLRNIFSKGDGNFMVPFANPPTTYPTGLDASLNNVSANNSSGYSNSVYMINAPGLYLAPYANTLVVVMNTYDNMFENIEVPDIPLNKWFNVIIQLQGSTLNVFINGIITESMQLVGVAKQNYGNVNVAMNGGFGGFESNLTYYNYAIGTKEIYDLVKRGPDTTMADSSMAASQLMSSNYLSLRWYLFGA